ncbi:MAG: DUF1326 domain-containing protein [Betaproteobacteria bacterium]
MSRSRFAVPVAALGVLFSFGSAAPRQAGASGPDWSINMSVIEACSCPMFCQCFFTGKPPASGGHGEQGAGHGDHMGGKATHFCRFNQGYKVNAGHFGAVQLDGAKFWFAGDAGEDFALPKLDWAVLRFDSAVTREQREGLLAILHSLHFYRPERWRSFAIGASARMKWAADSRHAQASLDGGKTAELVLDRLEGMNGGPVTMNNMDYFGYPRNDGFVLMPTKVEAYRAGKKSFEFRGTNGLLTTVEISSKDVGK